jgi:hypothetical protein
MYIHKPVKIIIRLINSFFYYDELAMFIWSTENSGLLKLLRCLNMLQLGLIVLASQTVVQDYVCNVAVTYGLHETSILSQTSIETRKLWVLNPNYLCSFP